MPNKKHKVVASKETKLRQKENLKTLVENSNVSKVRSASRVFKYGAASFARNIWLSIASTLVMTVTLVILLVTIGASIVLSSIADTMREKIDITVYLKPGTSYEVLNNLADIVKTDANVKSVEVADSASEYQLYISENQANTDLMEVLQDPTMNEIMLNTMQAKMRIKVHDPDRLEDLRYIVENNPTFQENIDPETEPTYDENRTAIENISSWANIAKNGGLILGAVFLVISILMIFNTIRMAIFSRREEIYMMRLVGADAGFIRGPFLVEAQICGVISGLLASTLAYVGYRCIAPGLLNNNIDISTISKYMDSSYLVLVYLGVIAVGILVGTISARLAMHKYLK